jgi:hypothetical protein
LAVAATLNVAATSAIETCPPLLSHHLIRNERFTLLAHFCLTFVLAPFSVVLGFAPHHLIMRPKTGFH